MKTAVTIISLLWTLLMVLPVSAQQKMNEYQKEYLTNSINQSLDKLFQFWQEENYLEGLYAMGSTKSKSLISQEEFAERMNRNPYKLFYTDTKLVEMDIRAYTYAILSFDMSFQYKLNPGDRVNVKILLQAFYEKQKDGSYWRFDLLEIISLPYKI